MKILHLADLQVRLYKRRDEYRYVFKKLEESIVENKPDTIAICGDVVHNKVSLSPESIDLTSDFLRMLIDYANVYMIPGNHDLVVINRDRLDALTPIVKNINSKKIHYYTESKLVDINEELTFGIFSLIDRDHFPIHFKRLNRKYIALYHGSLNGVVYENEQTTKSPDDNVSIFENYDVAMCGDIHRRQQIGKAFYSGSLLQQNYGESNEKGCLLWDLDSLTHEFIKLDNLWSYNTIDLTENKELPDLQLSEKPRIRVILNSPTVSEIQKVYTDTRNKWSNVEEIVVKHKEQNGKDNNLTKIEDVSTLENIEKLLEEYLRDKTNDETIRKIIEINKEMFCRVPDDFSIRNVTWNLEELEINDMFSYGKNNKIDFRNYSNNIVLISAPNRSGKSVLISSILQIITGKNDKFRKNAYVINNKENECYGSVVIRDGDKRYKIERTIKRGENYSSSTNLRFYEIDGKSENEQQKTDTEKVLRRMFGSYEELTLTSFGLQFKITNFVEEARESYRIKTFSKFLGLDVFEYMFGLVKEDVKELESTIKTYGDLDFSRHISENINKLRKSEKILNDLGLAIELIDNEKSILEHDIIELKSRVGQEDDVDFDFEIEIINDDIRRTKDNINAFSHNLTVDKPRLQILDDEIFRHNKQDILNSIQKLEKEVEEYTNKKISLESKKTSLSNDNEKVNILNSQNIDYDNSLCKNCRFYNDAKALKEELENIRNEVDFEEIELIKLENCSDNLRNKREELQRYEKILSLHDSMSKDVEMLELKLENSNSLLVKYEKELQDLCEQKKNAIDKIDDIKLLKIKSTKLQEINDKLSLKNDELINVKSDIKLRQENIVSFENSLKKLKELEDKYNAYKLYKDAIAKDGIPYQMLSKSIDYINSEINNILENFVNFRVRIETDETEKDLSIMMQSEDGTESPVEGGSGMEKTIAAIAIRAALIKISNLPKCNMFVLDEFSSALDTKYINSIESMINYLKNMFDIVLIISHQDEIKDIADSQINVVKSQGYSKIISN